jgi:hypothetical protein
MLIDLVDIGKYCFCEKTWLIFFSGGNEGENWDKLLGTSVPLVDKHNVLGKLRLWVKPSSTVPMWSIKSLRSERK